MLAAPSLGNLFEQTAVSRTSGAAAQMLRAAFIVRTGDHDHITVRIAEPNFPVWGPRIDVRFFDDLGSQPASSRHRRVEIVDLEPQDDTMPRPRCVGVDEVWVLFHIPSVKLKKQPTRARNTIIEVTMVVFR